MNRSRALGSLWQTLDVRPNNLRTLRFAVLAFVAYFALGCASLHRSAIEPDATTPDNTLNDFISAVITQDYELAYSLVAPSSKRDGDPIAYNADLDFDSFCMEIDRISASEKFQVHRIGATRVESSERVRIKVVFQESDRDESLLIREEGRWFLADPIHLIR